MSRARTSRPWSSVPSQLTESGRDGAAMLPDVPAQIGIAIVGRRRELAAESRLGIVREDGKVKMPVIGDDQRTIVGDEFGAEAQEHQREKDPERPEPALVGPEISEAPPRQGRQPKSEPALPRRSGQCGRGRAHAQRVPKSMRGSTTM